MYKILGIDISDPGIMPGFLHYRMFLPFTALAKNGWFATWRNADSLTYRRLNEADAIFTPRILNTTMKVKPKQIVDLDDDLFVNEEDKIAVQKVDGITVSTEFLKSVVQQYTNKPIHVCYNSIDISAFPANRKEETEEIVIGLLGSSQHESDWRILKNVLPSIMNENKNVSLHICGFVPAYMQEMVKTFGNRVIATNNFIGYNNYVKLLPQIDIRLSPIDPRFRVSHSKSGIAAIEILAAHGLPICQDMRVYTDVVTHNENGLLCNYTENSWYDAINLAISDRDLRKRLSDKGRKDVEDKWDINKNWIVWANAFAQILEDTNG